MSFITISRLVILTLIIIAALVTLGISIHFLVLETSVPGGFDAVIVFPLVVAILALLIAPIFLIVGLIRTKAWVSMIVVEFPTLGVLFLVWIVLAALANESANLLFPFGCSKTSFEDAFTPEGSALLESICREYFGLAAIGFVASIFTLIYLLVLLIFIIIGKTRGNSIWLVSVGEADFFRQNNANTNAIANNNSEYAMSSGDLKPGTIMAVPMVNGVPVGPPVQMSAEQVGSTQVGLPGMGGMQMMQNQNQMQLGYSMNPQV